MRAAAAELAAIGIAVDVSSIQAVTPEPEELRAALRTLSEASLGASWLDTLWVTLGGAGIPVERTPEGFRRNYYRGVLRGQQAWYVASEKRVLFNSAFAHDADTGLLLAHELTHAAQDQREGIAKIYARFGPTTDGLLLARCLMEGEAEAAALAVALHRKEQSLATLPAATVAVTSEEEDDGAMRLHYALGRVFVVRAFQRGGWKAVHEALAAPPENTSVLAQPERPGGHAPRMLELPAYGPPEWEKPRSPATTPGGSSVCACS